MGDGVAAVPLLRSDLPLRCCRRDAFDPCGERRACADDCRGREFAPAQYCGDGAGLGEPRGRVPALGPPREVSDPHRCEHLRPREVSLDRPSCARDAQPILVGVFDPSDHDVLVTRFRVPAHREDVAACEADLVQGIPFARTKKSGRASNSRENDSNS